MPEINTIEEARAEILRLNDVVTTVTAERDAAREIQAETEKRLQEVRDLNQQYFLRLTSQNDPDPDDKDDDADVPTLEEFALSLKI